VGGETLTCSERAVEEVLGAKSEAEGGAGVADGDEKVERGKAKGRKAASEVTGWPPIDKASGSAIPSAVLRVPS
jgi:hypothetical protein